MSTEPIRTSHGESLELPAAELLRRARPLPPHEDMVIDDLTEEECAAFLARSGGVSDLPARGLIVIDTDVFGADIVPAPDSPRSTQAQLSLVQLTRAGP